MKIGAVVLIMLLILLGLDSAFAVKEGQRALLLQFGRIVQADEKPGLHFKWPLLQQVVRLDDRILELDVEAERCATADGRNVLVDAYAKWRIADHAAYYRATGGDRMQAAQRLVPLLKDALRAGFNARKLPELVTGGDAGLLAGMQTRIDDSARRDLGIAVLDLHVKRIDLTDEMSDSLYKRMRAERQQQANALRYGGQEAAAKIRADADRQGQVLRADAERDAATTRGEGDAEAAAIYARAAAQDPEFFAFYRSLDAYRAAFKDGRGVIVLKHDADFLRYFNEADPARH